MKRRIRDGWAYQQDGKVRLVDPGADPPEGAWPVFQFLIHFGRRQPLLELYSNPELLASATKAQSFSAGKSLDPLTKRLDAAYLQLRKQHGRNAGADGAEWLDKGAAGLEPTPQPSEGPRHVHFDRHPVDFGSDPLQLHRRRPTFTTRVNMPPWRGPKSGRIAVPRAADR